MSNLASQLSNVLQRFPVWAVIALAALYAVIMWIAYSPIGGMLGGQLLPLVIVFLTVFGLFVVYSVHQPYYLVMLLVGATYVGSLVTIVEEGLVPFSLFQLLLIMSFGLFLLHRLYIKNFEITITGMELEWFLFFGFISLTLIYAPDPFDGTIYLLRLLVLFAMVYVLINVVHRSEDISYVMYFLIGISLILALSSIFFMVTNPQALAEGVVSEGARLDRETLLEMDPNRFAALFILPIAFLASITLSGWLPKYRIVAMVLLFIMLMGMLSAYSRSVMLATGLMLVLIAMLYRQYQLFIWFAILGLVSVLIIPDLRYFALNVVSRFLDIFAGATDDSSRIRILLGLAAVYMFFDSYMIGVGFRGFQHHFTDYFTTQESIGVVMPHNIFYTIGAELGIIGLLLYVFILWRIGYTGYTNIKLSTGKLQRANSVALFSAFIGLLIFYQFYGGALWDNNLWAIIAFIFAQHWLIIKNK